MNPDSRGAWNLAENATMRLPRGRRVAIVRVEQGTVLVTREGDHEDHVLERGDELVLGGGIAVAWAFTEAVLSVREATLVASNMPPSTSPGRLAPIRGVV